MKARKFKYKTRDAFFVDKIDYLRKPDESRNIDFSLDDAVYFHRATTILELIEFAQKQHKKLLEEKGEGGFLLTPLDIKLKMEGSWDSVYTKVYTDCIKESDEDYDARIKKDLKNEQSENRIYQYNQSSL